MSRCATCHRENPGPLDEKAPKRGLITNAACPGEFEMSLTDGETFVLDVPEGEQIRRRVRVRVIGPQSMSTLEIDPHTLIGLALPFCTEDGLASLTDEVASKVAEATP